MEQDLWLTPSERLKVIGALTRFGLIKWSNDRNLPLKSGGFTDIYVNLRDMRSVPEATAYLADLYGPTLLRLGVRRFVEVPESVSGLAGAISARFGIPYITIRAEAKDGRVSSAKVIGQCLPNELVSTLDDVITDGGSKVGPLQECQKLGLRQGPMVVLVDRQQGWKENFERLGIRTPVWAGMTLHDIRAFLIRNNLMERCDPTAEAKNPLIVAYDGKTWEKILPFLDLLRRTGCIIKVNDLLFDEGIGNLIPELSVYGRVMADLKSHDIPNTIANIMKHCRNCPPWAVTVHASGGGEMIKAAKQILARTGTLVLAVTVLTSLKDEHCKDIFRRDSVSQVKKSAKIAKEAGADGVVCSPRETTTVLSVFPEAIVVNPGVRSAGADTHDQARVDTPENAIQAGAKYVVMGREIMNADDPVAKVKEINERLAV